MYVLRYTQCARRLRLKEGKLRTFAVSPSQSFCLGMDQLTDHNEASTFGRKQKKLDKEFKMYHGMWGIYAGIEYMVVNKEGKWYISVSQVGMALIAAGANARLLDDVDSNADPDDIVRQFVESTPQKED